MLWYKTWLDTRGRFVTGVVLAALSALAIVRAWSQARPFRELTTGVLPERLPDVLQQPVRLLHDYHAFIRIEWLRDEFTILTALFAILLGVGNLPSTSVGIPYILTLPISRSRILVVRAVLGHLQFLVVILVPLLLVYFLSPLAGESFPLRNVFLHAASAFVAASVFFAFALGLTAWLGDIWRPLLVAIGTAVVLALLETTNMGIPTVIRLFDLMNGTAFTKAAEIPWVRILVAVSASVLLHWWATVLLNRRDH